MNEGDNNSTDGTTVESVDYITTLQEQLEYLPFNENFEIEPANLKLLKQLGGGHFGDIHLGLLTENGFQLPVAVKTPKSSICDRLRQLGSVEREEELNRQRDSLRDELKIMSFLPSHSNVIKLIGAITTSRDDFCVVIEYCEYGGLDRLLREKFKNDKYVNELILKTDSEEYLDYRCIQSNERVKSIESRMYNGQERSGWMADYSTRRNSGLITTSDLLWFALQIARAMSFLTENMVLHRDVALRNVLLKSDFTIRVADFGLSRRFGDDGYYMQSRNVSIPYRYIAPESLRSGRFSSQSESWSFGVVLWELFTFAQHQPYAAEEYCDIKTVHDILDYLDSGKRLNVPEGTPRNIARMMIALWHEDPTQRPTFQMCHSNLHSELLMSNPLILNSSGKPQQCAIVTADLDAGLPKESDLNNLQNTQKLDAMKRRFRILIGMSAILLIMCIALPTAMYFILRTPAESSSTIGLSGEKCHQCLCLTEMQSCAAVNCTEDDDSLSRGIFQISLPYYNDCGAPGKLPGDNTNQAWRRCSNDIKCAVQCIKNYVKRYSINCQSTGCEQTVRLHHGGPNGCIGGVTDGFWKETAACLKSHQ
uniref:lysozyme n=1 Tax=Plectus sambesii TaxID=2011161 RepID=A0A914VET0_9BILA